MPLLIEFNLEDLTKDLGELIFQKLIPVHLEVYSHACSEFPAEHTLKWNTFRLYNTKFTLLEIDAKFKNLIEFNLEDLSKDLGELIFQKLIPVHLEVYSHACSEFPAEHTLKWNTFRLYNTKFTLLEIDAKFKNLHYFKLH